MMMHIEDPDDRCQWCGSPSFFHRLWLRMFCSVYRQIVQQWVGGVVPTVNFHSWQRAEMERLGWVRIPGREMDRDPDDGGPF